MPVLAIRVPIHTDAGRKANGESTALAAKCGRNES
jgi:hypothetical protein